MKDADGQVIQWFGTNTDITERQRAEEALRESEEHYHSLFNNMLNRFAYCQMLFEQNQPVDFIYLNVNSAFEDLTGLKNVVGKRFLAVFPKPAPRFTRCQDRRTTAPKGNDGCQN